MSNLVIYRSSAGSGKTYTLVKEYLSLILASEHPFFYRRILAITFTNKAASELKERIIHQLFGLSKLDPKYFDEALLDGFVKELSLPKETIQKRAGQIVQHMLYNYGDLAVSTIDKFVVKILRYFNKELNLNADFSVELNTKQVLAMSVERMMENIGIDPVLTKMSMTYAQQKSEGNKSWRIDEDLNKIAELLKQEESQIAAEQLDKTDEKTLIEELKSTKNRIKELNKKITEIGEECLDLLGRNSDLESFMTVSIVKFFKKLGSKNRDNYFYPSDAVLKSLNGSSWWPQKNKKMTEVTSGIDGLQSELQPSVASVLEVLPELVLQQLLLDAFTPLMFTKRINKEIDSLKNEQNVVLINDNNKLISSVVRNNPSPFIYEKLGERYQHFMIDEFQDTSVVQWHNFIPLVEEALGLGHRNILVGDSKQSIYRFRGGEMEQLAQLPNIHKGEELHKLTERVFKSNLAERNLEYNYRSRKEIVEFNNDLFEYVLSRKDDRIKTLYNQFAQIPKKKAGGLVTMNILEKADDDEMLENIHRLITQSREAGYEFGDIAILVYRNSIGRLIAEYCKRHNLPVVSNESLLLKNQENIVFIISLIKNLIAPDHKGHQLSILTYLHKNMETDESIHSFLKNHLSERKDFDKVFTDYNLKFDRSPLMQLDVYSLCESLCKRFKINSSEAYMMEFLNIASGFVRKEKGSISAFLEYWTLNEDRFSLQLSESSKAINILSVHKSKGLEFPVVINPYYFKKFKKHSQKYLWIKENEGQDHLQLLPVKDAALNTRFGDLISEEEYKTSVDQLNVLYVATTRAKEVLHIIVPAPSATALKSNSKRMDCLLYNFGQRRSDENQGLMEWGKSIAIERKRKGDEEMKYLKEYPTMDWRTELRIAISDEQKGDELTFGNRLHELIAETNSKDEIGVILKKFKHKHFLKDEDYGKIKNSLEAVYNINQFSDWHNKSVEVLNEKEIIHANGKILRPDRIFVLENEVIVVDFKTGVERKSHLKQVIEYAEALVDLGYDNTSGYVLYTENSELKKVI